MKKRICFDILLVFTETGFGNVELKEGKVSVRMVYGTLDVKKTVIDGKEM
jgi:hypothetical protein